MCAISGFRHGTAMGGDVKHHQDWRKAKPAMLLAGSLGDAAMTLELLRGKNRPFDLAEFACNTAWAMVSKAECASALKSAGFTLHRQHPVWTLDPAAVMDAAMKAGPQNVPIMDAQGRQVGGKVVPASEMAEERTSSYAAFRASVARHGYRALSFPSGTSRSGAHRPSPSNLDSTNWSEAGVLSMIVREGSREQALSHMLREGGWTKDECMAAFSKFDFDALDTVRVQYRARAMFFDTEVDWPEPADWSQEVSSWDKPPFAGEADLWPKAAAQRFLSHRALCEMYRPDSNMNASYCAIWEIDREALYARAADSQQLAECFLQLVPDEGQDNKLARLYKGKPSPMALATLHKTEKMLNSNKPRVGAAGKPALAAKAALAWKGTFCVPDAFLAAARGDASAAARSPDFERFLRRYFTDKEATDMVRRTGAWHW
jgi:hypothetical protein